jgi:hypothetical protein
MKGMERSRRARLEQVKPKMPDLRPNTIQAGRHAAEPASPDDRGRHGNGRGQGRRDSNRNAAASGACLKAMPTHDARLAPGRIRKGWWKLATACLFHMISSTGSTGPRGTSDAVASAPPEEALRPLSEGGRPLIHA